LKLGNIEMLNVAGFSTAAAAVAVSDDYGVRA
jgi:hypothetical protein